ncbi:MAG: hypothetical protein JWO36_6842 [Myxococcales bacterium]|nr:hypothetical protein [Myxococcales bacterium]
MTKWIVLALFVPAIARGQATPTAAEILTSDARVDARNHACQAVEVLRRRVQEIDPAYYAAVFAVDPEIIQCSVPSAIVPESVELPTPIQDDSYRSPATAVALSLGVTLGGYGMAALGSSLDRHSGSSSPNALTSVGALVGLVGPSVGHLYAGDAWNRGLAIRASGLAAALVGVAVWFSGCPLFGNHCDHGAEAVGVTLLFVGEGVYIGGSIYEIATAGRAAREYNAEHRIHTQISIAPMPIHDGGGMALIGRF